MPLIALAAFIKYLVYISLYYFQRRIREIELLTAIDVHTHIHDVILFVFHKRVMMKGGTRNILRRLMICARENNRVQDGTCACNALDNRRAGGCTRSSSINQVIGSFD